MLFALEGESDYLRVMYVWKVKSYVHNTFSLNTCRVMISHFSFMQRQKPSSDVSFCEGGV